ncbi:hypothetical protein GJ496_000129 [Pomphorhynchus laevis]|nr:hypothetical protein GJ496_000129 [Pomphorhynchus laevis]
MDLDMSEVSEIFTDNFDPLEVANVLPKKYYAAPTVEELHQLRETETLFHSNLVRLQIGELLDEVNVPNNLQDEICKFVNNLKRVLKLIEPCQIDDNVTVSSSILPPFTKSSNVNRINQAFQCQKPVRVEVVGSFKDNTLIHTSETLNIDLVFIMARSSFIRTDFNNMRFYIKRALYIDYIKKYLSSKLTGTDDAIICKLMVIDEDYRKPLLIISPKASNGYQVRLHILPEAGTFSSSRFDVDKCCIRKKWYENHKSDSPECSSTLIQSSYTNASILSEINGYDINAYIYQTLNSSSFVIDALKLLKIWIRQRRLSTMSNGFSNFCMKCLVVWLLFRNKISPQMSHYQIFRCVLSYIASTDKLSICFEGSFNDQLDKLKHMFACIILWKDGCYNICHNVSTGSFRMLQFEARRSLELLDRDNGFHNVFIDALTSDLYFDNFVRFEIDCDNTDTDAADFCNLNVILTKYKLFTLIEQALTDRLSFAVYLSPRSLCWSYDAVIPICNTLTLGILFTEHSDRLIDRCHSIENNASFKQFWGDVVSLRRFNDGTITEAVHWPCNNMDDKLHVWTRIIRYVLKRHLPDVLDVSFTSNQFDEYVTYPSRLMSNLQNLNRERINIINEFSELLHGIQGLPLTIQSVWPVLSPTFRNSNPNDDRARSIPMVCRLEYSGRWPKDLDAVRRLIHALNIRISQSLRKKNLYCRLSEWKGSQYVLVTYKQLTFRIILFSNAELRLAMNASDCSIVQMWKNIKVCRDLSSMQHDFRLWHSTVCLSKRWLSANLLLEEWSEITVELICSHIFTKHQPFPAPRSLIVAFKRFLSLMANHKWYDDPLFVNDDTLSYDHVSSIREQFKINRSSFPYASVITCGPDDDIPYVVNKSPPAVLVQRTVKLASQCLNRFQYINLLRSANVKSCFTYPESIWDVRIILDNRITDTGVEIQNMCDFDCVEIFFQALKDSYGRFALFLQDKYSDEKEILVVWKKDAFEPKPLTINNAALGGGQLSTAKANQIVHSNRQLEYDPLQFIEQWKILGLGIVKCIQTRNWSN